MSSHATVNQSTEPQYQNEEYKSWFGDSDDVRIFIMSMPQGTSKL